MCHREHGNEEGEGRHTSLVVHGQLTLQLLADVLHCAVGVVVLLIVFCWCWATSQVKSGRLEVGSCADAVNGWGL